MRTMTSHDSMVRIESVRVDHMMTQSPIMLRSGTFLGRAARVFSDHKVGAIPIVDEQDRLLGVLSYTDVLRGILGPKRNLS
jgi:acetoin utilization protein AcuB